MKNKIKIILLTVCLLLIGNSRNYQILADGSVRIEASQASGEPGGTVAVTFSVSDNPGTTMYEMKIVYDTTVLEVISIEKGDCYPEWFETDISSRPLYISAGDALSLDNLTDNCELATVYFKISERAEAGEYYFSVEDGLFLNGALDEYKVDYDNSGCITVRDSSTQTSDSEGGSFSEKTEHSQNDNNIGGNKAIQDSSERNGTEAGSSKDTTEEKSQESVGVENDREDSTAASKDEAEKEKGSIIAAITMAVTGICAGGLGVMRWRKYKINKRKVERTL